MRTEDEIRIEMQKVSRKYHEAERVMVQNRNRLYDLFRELDEVRKANAVGGSNK